MLTKNDKKVWIFTFEYAGIVKVGGLGEVPANQAKILVNHFNITVFLPSHGQIERLKKSEDLEKLSFNCVGRLDPALLGIKGIESSYKISFYRLKLNGVNIILLSGENAFTRKFLDDNIVYNPDTFKGKLCLFSLGMKCYIEYLIDNKKEDLPNVIHMHDYHVVIPFIEIKQTLVKNGFDVSSIITIHLLTWPRYNIEFYYVCGIDDTPFKIRIENKMELMDLKQIFAICEKERKEGEKYKPPTVEKIGAIVSDLVTTVSKSYLKSDIIPNLGQELINFKSDFVWDGCDWNYNEIYQKVFQSLGDEMHHILSIPNNSEISRQEMKRYLLNYKIGHLKQSPLINSEKILNVIKEISKKNPFIRNGNIKSFLESGPLVIATGRISKQKGFETILEGMPKVISVIPNAKFLLLLLPTEYSLTEIKKYANYIKQYPENLRIIFGLAAEIFFLAHIAADVYCALSRWEPFGIIALEAMSSKLPVIATKIGGLQETIIDIREDPENGTGILIEKENPLQFAEALISLFKLAEISENSNNINELEMKIIVDQIPDEIIRPQVLKNAHFYNKIKENCYKRVENNFRWNIVSKKLIDLYKEVTEL